MASVALLLVCAQTGSNFFESLAGAQDGGGFIQQPFATCQVAVGFVSVKTAISGVLMAAQSGLILVLNAADGREIKRFYAPKTVAAVLQHLPMGELRTEDQVVLTDGDMLAAGTYKFYDIPGQAQPLQQVLPPDAELLVQVDICSDSTRMDCGGSLQCRIDGALHGVLAGTVQIGCDSRQQVLIKLGHHPGIRALAVHLGQQWEAWYQVERELAVRGSLAQPPRNLARLVAAGTVVGLDCSRRVNSSSTATTNGSKDLPSSIAHNSSSSPVGSSEGSTGATLQAAISSSCSLGLVGRRVLVLEAAGVPLVQGGVLPNLGLSEAMHLLRCLLMLVVDLLDNGVYWNDCRPSNIGIDPCAPWYQCYYGFDLGAASSKAVDLWASDTIYPGERRKLLPSEYSPVADLAYSSTQAIRGEQLDSTCDLQSAVYTAYVLTGNDLPWQMAADAGDVLAVLQARQLAAANPAMLPGLAAWPCDEQQLAYAAIRGEKRVVSIARQIVASR